MATSSRRSATTTTQRTPSNVRPLLRTNQNAYHAIPFRAAPPVRGRTRSATSSTGIPEETPTTEEPHAVTRRGRGRRRTLPFMTNSERARYYRQKSAQQTDELETTTRQLRKEVAHLELRLRIHRQLVHMAVAPIALHQIITFVQHFVEVQLHTKSHGLHEQTHEIVNVDLWGDAHAPIIHVVSVLRGRLTTPVIHSIYPFVLGNTIVLDELMHQQIVYRCLYLFFFAADGSLERETVEIETIPGLRRPLLNLATVARVVSSVDVHPHESTEPVARARRIMN